MGAACSIKHETSSLEKPDNMTVYDNSSISRCNSTTIVVPYNDESSRCDNHPAVIHPNYTYLLCDPADSALNPIVEPPSPVLPLPFVEFFESIKKKTLSIKEANFYIAKYPDIVFAVDSEKKDAIQHAIESGNVPLFRLFIQRKIEVKNSFY